MPDPAPTPPPAGTPCPECGFVNAVNSLYCQDCGAKLAVAAPSYLSAAPPAGPEIAGAPAARPSPARKPRILSARRESSVGFLGATFRTILYAAFIAALVQLFRAPRDLPPPAPPIAAAVVEQVREKFAESARRGVPVDAPWDRTNAYLAGVLAPASGEGGSSFVRALVLPRPEGFALVTEKMVAGRLPVRTEIDYRVVGRGSGLSLVVAGGAIGRLPVPAFAAPILALVGGDLGPALKFELDLLANARGIRFSPASARVDFAPARP